VAKVLVAVGWIVIAALALVAFLRVFAWDDLEPFAVLNCVTAFVYLPAWLVVIGAVVGRRFWLAGAALAVVVAQIAFLYPEFAAAQPLPTWTNRAPSLRLLDANVYNENPSMSGYIRQIREFRPQLVTMEEAIPADVSQLRRSGALADLPYQIEISRDDPFAFFIASRYPLTGENAVYLPDRPLVVQATLKLPSGPQALWVVHTISPQPESFTQWQNDLAEVAHLIRAHGPDRLLVVGDFNATWGNRGFHQVLDTGMTDGAAARGDALSMTWSQTKPIIPPVVRIDHVLTGPGVEVTHIQTGEGVGSDHRDLIATVAFDRSGGTDP
jgi:endonuclease/exonuclease/phosphatase (EEP) superfamily protein YafD